MKTKELVLAKLNDELAQLKETGVHREKKMKEDTEQMKTESRKQEYEMRKLESENLTLELEIKKQQVETRKLESEVHEANQKSRTRVISDRLALLAEVEDAELKLAIKATVFAELHRVEEGSMKMEAHSFSPSLLLPPPSSSIIMEPEEDEKQPEFCDDFTTLVRRIGHVDLVRAEMIAMGKYIAAAFRKEFRSEPKKMQKFVEGANRSVNVYPRRHDIWLQSQVKQFLSILDEK